MKKEIIRREFLKWKIKGLSYSDCQKKIKEEFDKTIMKKAFIFIITIVALTIMLNFVSAENCNGYFNISTQECWSSKEHPPGVSYPTNSSEDSCGLFKSCCFNFANQQVDCNNSSIIINPLNSLPPANCENYLCDDENGCVCMDVPLIPEFSLIAGLVAVAGALGVFFIIRRDL